MRLKDKVAIVTGAGRNIGEQTALLFTDEGAKVSVVDMDEERGKRTVETINQSHPGSAIYISADVSNEQSVKDMIAETVNAFGRLDVLVNNVAISDNKTIFECSLDDFNKVLAVTLTSQFLTSKYAAEQMLSQGDGGSIVNIGSTSGFQGRESAIAYAAAKGGVANLMRGLAVQLAPHKIRVNSVVPNKIGSPVGQEEFDPTRSVPNLAGRAGEPRELAQAVLFMASDESRFVYGENLVVDGGFSAMM